MTMLVTLAQAKLHLRVTHDSEDGLIEMQVHAASGAVINYLKEAGADSFLDSSGEVILNTDSPPAPDVPQLVQEATLLLVGWMFNYREGEAGPATSSFVPGYLPPPVMSLLYMLRDPTLA